MDSNPDDKGLRSLTEKGYELYEDTKQSYLKKINHLKINVLGLFDKVESLEDVDSATRTSLEEELNTLYRKYKQKTDEFIEFLKRKNTEDSQKDLSSFINTHDSLENKMDNALHALKLVPVANSKSKASDCARSKRSSICGSTTSSRLRAKAEGARMRVEFAKREAELLKKMALIDEEQKIAEAKANRLKAEFDADIQVLSEEKEVAAIEAEASVLEDGKDSRARATSLLDLPEQKSHDKSQEYVEHLPPQDYGVPQHPIHLSTSGRSSKQHLLELNPEAVPFRPVCHQTYPGPETVHSKPETDLMKYLVKKDLLLSRLTPFNDQPETFGVWQASFGKIMNELDVTASEELDLLVKYLGPVSGKYAISIRNANASNPYRGLRFLWERLQERYGSPELIEHCLKSKITRFPKLTNNDHEKLYELSDILSEIQSVMEDPKYATLFSVYDSSSGVNTVVNKLPYSLQNNWISHAAKYKRDHNVPYPPFTVFANFIREMSRIRNDPAFLFESDTVKKNRQPLRTKTHVFNMKTDVKDNLESSVDKRCPIHNSNHSLLDCHAFAAKPWDERRAFLKKMGLCYKCISTTEHLTGKCPVKVKCEKCGRMNHLTVMHRDAFASAQFDHGGEMSVIKRPKEETVTSRCTSLCDKDFKGRSCGKIVLVDVCSSEKPENCFRTYALLDDQSNRSLITKELCDIFSMSGETTRYTLSSCSGSATRIGRRVGGLSVCSIDRLNSFKLPVLIECDGIPQDISEIPTPDVTQKFPHLHSITSNIPDLDSNCTIDLLIGRDAPDIHHVEKQITGPKCTPFAQKLPLGWVVIGQVCLGKVHQPDSLRVYETKIDMHSRASIFEPCKLNFHLKEDLVLAKPEENDIFIKTSSDNIIGLSADDRDFLKIMDSEFRKDASGQWVAPLPFKSPRPKLPNNRTQVWKRAKLLETNLRKHPQKMQHFVTFMDKVFASGAAEEANEIRDPDRERWYLPLFGVYHPRKPDQIRGVFDSSVVFEGLSLNNLLLSGPNLTNSLLGVLLRFRKDRYAITADVEQMFYRFLVCPEHRDFLRFFWFKDNDTNQPLIEYRMTVHVFGNRPSPAVATYGLSKSVEHTDSDVKRFVEKDFYVDDALTSQPTRDKAVTLLKKTQHVLAQEGRIKLHKIASNDVDIMQQFDKDELEKSLKDLNLNDDLPSQQGLGLTWNLNSDTFVFCAPGAERTFTKRGLLAMVNSVFDPIGFLAPFTVSGKLLLRETCSEKTGWDDPLPQKLQEPWKIWKDTLCDLDGYEVPRMYGQTSLSLAEEPLVHIYSDASENAIAATAYIFDNADQNKQPGFLMGKAKIAPKSGHTIPRLELCGAVLAVEIGSFISDQLDIPLSTIRFFTDSQVVLGYIKNRTRRFYTYVSNRVARIQEFSTPEQWKYVPSEANPADAATRSTSHDIVDVLRQWQNGPNLTQSGANNGVLDFPLVEPENDCEIRPEICTKKTDVVAIQTIEDRFEKFSSWRNLVSAFATLQHVAQSFKKEHGPTCNGWHLCNNAHSGKRFKASELFILKTAQRQSYGREISVLEAGLELPKDSDIRKLSPFVDESGLLRVGGRLRNMNDTLGLVSVNPVIIPKGHVARLLIHHFHEKTYHQGRHITEGSIRSHGYWIIGCKKMVSSVIYQCVLCKKLRGKPLQQRMADLPADRLSPGPPFTSVGVDVFGPWQIVTRRTRGGVVNDKRWAVLFTCLTSRAVHIEVLENMTSSCFLNALRRFISLRGSVQTFRSDRGTNFVGAADEMRADVINVEDNSFRRDLRELNNPTCVWSFNAPHASHMGGVWERAIGIARRILDGIFLKKGYRDLTHEVLCTFMAEVCAIMNSRPIAVLDTDANDPLVLTPNLLLTQKQNGVNQPTVSNEFTKKDMFVAQWKHVQALSDIFWKRWRDGYLDQLQTRRKWQSPCSNVKEGDIVLVRDGNTHRYDWPLAIVEKPLFSDDRLVRKATVRLFKNGKSVFYTRPVNELVLLLE